LKAAFNRSESAVRRDRTRRDDSAADAEKIMKAWFISRAVGVLVGLLYSVVNVKSPAPPTIALVGLLGMLAGEHAITFARRLATHAFG
jgi:XapX domain-containing protein